MTFLIKTSYSANKKADVLTFINSYLYEPFNNVYKLFLKHQEKNNWNEEIRYQKKTVLWKIIITVFACKFRRVKYFSFYIVGSWSINNI